MEERRRPYAGNDAPLEQESYRHLRLDRRGARLNVRIDRAQAANSLNDRLVEELLSVFNALYWADDVRVVTLSGEGRHFCAGLDMNERRGRADPTPGGSFVAQRRISEIVMAMRRCPQPIIACINGAASGGGFALALAADVRVGTPDLRMNAAFLKIGLSGCDIGVSYFLPRLCGAGFAAEFLMTGRFITAERALAANLVSAIAEGDALDAIVDGFVDDMLATSPLGLRMTKEGLNHAIDATGLAQVIAMEDRQQILCTYDPAFEAALGAFRDARTEKREAVT